MTMFKNPDLRLNPSVSKSGTAAWASPSNLAIIKYWGKYGRQLPQNPSISFTLDAARSETQIQWSTKETANQEIEMDFFFDDQPNEAFKNKQVKFLDSILEIFPFLNQLKFTIHSKNTFPHSAGIASSASSMSALAMCLCTIEKDLFGTLTDSTEFLQKASFVSRLGSGSACRSVYPVFGAWGESDYLKGSSNLFAIPFTNYHSIFSNFHDDILLISKREKSVSSTAGHGLMIGNPYADIRFQQAKDQMEPLLKSLQNGDLETFGTIAENEALTLHALMMTSNPSYILMEANSLEAIRRVRNFRAETGHPLYFSLDAGPNLHLLYPDSCVNAVKAFIRSELEPLCEGGNWLEDQVGKGPVEL